MAFGSYENAQHTEEGKYDLRLIVAEFVAVLTVVAMCFVMEKWENKKWKAQASARLFADTRIAHRWTSGTYTMYSFIDTQGLTLRGSHPDQRHSTLSGDGARFRAVVVKTAFSRHRTY